MRLSGYLQNSPIRGGGGNFAIVTSFEYRLHPVGPIVLAGPIIHPFEDAREVLAFYRDFIATTPDELTTIFELSVAQPLPFLPEDVHSKPIVVVGSCYAGAPEDGIEVVRPLKEFGNPIVDLLEPKLYTELQYVRSVRSARLAPPLEVGRAAAAHRRRDRHARRTLLGVHLIEVVLHRLPARGRPRPRWTGRDRVQPARRRAQREHQRVWTEDDPEGERHVAWARDLFSAMQPHARGRVYLNFLGDEGADRIRQAYGGRQYERLVELKRAYDPLNFFRLNQNIQP